MHRKKRKDRMYFTLLELLIVIAIIAILASILLPALGKAKERAKTTLCMNKMKQLVVSIHNYAGDYNSVIPAPWNGTLQWNRVLGRNDYAPYWLGAANFQHYHCPCWSPLKWNNSYNDSYAMSLESDDGDVEHHRLGSLSNNWPLITESISISTMTQYYYIAKNTTWARIHLRHFKRGNTGFPDGHVSEVKASDVTSMGFYSY